MPCVDELVNLWFRTVLVDMSDHIDTEDVAGIVQTQIDDTCMLITSCASWSSDTDLAPDKSSVCGWSEDQELSERLDTD